jgi:hypothetical protein
MQGDTARAAPCRHLYCVWTEAETPARIRDADPFNWQVGEVAVCVRRFDSDISFRFLSRRQVDFVIRPNRFKGDPFLLIIRNSEHIKQTN